MATTAGARCCGCRAAGYAIYDEVAPHAVAFEARLLEGFDAEERELLFRLLDRLDELELKAEAQLF